MSDEAMTNSERQQRFRDRRKAVDELVELAVRRIENADPARLRRIRVAARLTLAEVAAALGVDAAVVSRWETGSRRVHRTRGGMFDEYVELIDEIEARVLKP